MSDRSTQGMAAIGGGVAQAYRARSVPRRAAVMAAATSGVIIALDVRRRLES